MDVLRHHRPINTAKSPKKFNAICFADSAVRECISPSKEARWIAFGLAYAYPACRSVTSTPSVSDSYASPKSAILYRSNSSMSPSMMFQCSPGRAVVAMRFAAANDRDANPSIGTTDTPTSSSFSATSNPFSRNTSRQCSTVRPGDVITKTRVPRSIAALSNGCLLYTSDAADE